MIAFACDHCGMKLRVQEQFAGRHSKGPTCKQPLVVPVSVTAAAEGEEVRLAQCTAD